MNTVPVFTGGISGLKWIAHRLSGHHDRSAESQQSQEIVIEMMTVATIFAHVWRHRWAHPERVGRLRIGCPKSFALDGRIYGLQPSAPHRISNEKLCAGVNSVGINLKSELRLYRSTLRVAVSLLFGQRQDSICLLEIPVFLSRRERPAGSL